MKIDEFRFTVTSLSYFCFASIALELPKVSSIIPIPIEGISSADRVAIAVGGAIVAAASNEAAHHFLDRKLGEGYSFKKNFLASLALSVGFLAAEAGLIAFFQPERPAPPQATQAQVVKLSMPALRR